MCTTNVPINYDFILSKSLNSPNLYISRANMWYIDYQNKNLNLCTNFSIYFKIILYSIYQKWQKFLKKEFHILYNQILKICLTSIEDCGWTMKELGLSFSPVMFIVFKRVQLKKSLFSYSAPSFFTDIFRIVNFDRICLSLIPVDFRQFWCYFWRYFKQNFSKKMPYLASLLYHHQFIIF